MAATDAGRLCVIFPITDTDIVAALRAETESGLFSSLYHARSYTITLVYLNSSLNPILYCWKVEEVRKTVKDTIGGVLCLCFSS